MAGGEVGDGGDQFVALLDRLHEGVADLDFVGPVNGRQPRKEDQPEVVAGGGEGTDPIVRGNLDLGGAEGHRQHSPRGRCHGSGQIVEAQGGLRRAAAHAGSTFP